jgi:hypothetical protein
MEDCFDKEYFLKWCLAHNPQPKRCEPLLKDLSTCYAKMLMGS